MNDISVIIPCLNYEKFIFQNLQKIVDKISLLNLNYEIIIVNDGSSDNTLSEIGRFIKINNKIKLINNKSNTGKSSSIISALENVNNKIVLIDCDIPYFDYFEKLLKN